ERCIAEAGIGFLMAPRHHGAMRHVAGPRIELGTRTVFNLLGPLSNPAGATRQLIGIFAEAWIEPLAEVLRALGSRHVWVVHGNDGLDEITTTGPTAVAELKDGAVRRFDLSPADFGVTAAAPESLKGGDAETNALALNAVLDGHEGAFRDIVLVNSAAALIVAGKAGDVREGVAMAAKVLDAGEARKVLERLVRISNEVLPDEAAQ
ncbi:MAG: anthranilate phosphoribosyltransferase, partial [Alphaproteobacteria bacterium]|nr:anthranilate phosphoribosyltransferase [Alphaproteobacteria bacterium]